MNAVRKRLLRAAAPAVPDEVWDYLLETHFPCHRRLHEIVRDLRLDDRLRFVDTDGRLTPFTITVSCKVVRALDAQRVSVVWPAEVMRFYAAVSRNVYHLLGHPGHYTRGIRQEFSIHVALAGRVTTVCLYGAWRVGPVYGLRVVPYVADTPCGDATTR